MNTFDNQNKQKMRTFNAKAVKAGPVTIGSFCILQASKSGLCCDATFANNQSKHSAATQTLIAAHAQEFKSRQALRIMFCSALEEFN